MRDALERVKLVMQVTCTLSCATRLNGVTNHWCRHSADYALALHTLHTPGKEAHKAWVDGKYSNLVKDDPSAAGISRTDLHVALVIVLVLYTAVGNRWCRPLCTLSSGAHDAVSHSVSCFCRCASPTGAAICASLYGLTREQFDTAKAGGGTDEQRRVVEKKSADSSKSDAVSTIDALFTNLISVCRFALPTGAAVGALCQGFSALHAIVTRVSSVNNVHQHSGAAICA
eukprot:10988-Heterococcus_DN1.PRE.1